MSRAINMPARRATMIELEHILLGPVRAGDGTAAETRTGAARILSRKLNSTDVFKVCMLGATSAASGGYLIEVAHMERGEVAVSSSWDLIGTIEAAGANEVEAAFSGKDIGLQAMAANTDRILTLGAITAGSGYSAAGTYTNVPLTGGTGSGAQATITVAGGAVTVVTLTARGFGYTAADALSAANSNLGGAGSGFSIPASTVGTIAEPRVLAIRLVAGTGSNGAATPSGVSSVWVSPVF
jgi:hypothetical protein